MKKVVAAPFDGLRIYSLILPEFDVLFIVNFAILWLFFSSCLAVTIYLPHVRGSQPQVRNISLPEL